VSEDRRRWRRLTHELRLQIQIAEGSGRTVSAIGSHLNPEGIFVQMADPPARGTHVVVTVEVDGIDGGVSAEGVVVDQVVLDQESKSMPGVGIRLDHRSPGWSKIYTWLQER
jgi:hypothetical protein